MAASLHHAHPVLSAASAAGFRESGLQSLRCLDDEGISPIVAVRSSGLALESVIGYCEVGDDDDDGEEPIIRSLVSEEYLRMLMDMSNERFEVNVDRKERFRAVLLDLYQGQKAKRSKSGWEDAEKRRERKRAEGLRRQQEAKEREYEADRGDISDSDELGSLF